MAKALVLVDLQEEWRDPQSDYFLGDLEELIEKTNYLIAVAREKGWGVIFVRHVEENSKGAFAEGGVNSRLIGELDRQEEDIVITKYRISPFYETELDEILEDCEEIVVSGVLTNLCVRSLINDAYDRDFQITLVEDCCRSTSLEMHEFTLRDLSETRPEVEIVGLKELVEK